MRGWTATWLLLFLANPTPAAVATAKAPAPLDVRVLAAPEGAAPEDSSPHSSGAGRTYWLKIRPPDTLPSPGIPVLVVHAAGQASVEVFAGGVALPPATTLAAFRGTLDRIYLMPDGFTALQTLYARIASRADDSREATAFATTLDEALERGADRARMVDLAVGALMSVSLAALLIWFVMRDKLFILYATFFFLQALYIAFLSGQGFDWPVLSYARPLSSFAWNVPISLGGAVGSLFTREIADLKSFSPRSYKAFGWIAVTFLALAAANIAKLFGHMLLVSAVGNLIFSMAAVFTLLVAFSSWRRGNRAAGWFLIAWGLLEGFAIAAAVRFLVTASEESDALLNYGLPLSMVAAAVLVALGVADRLKQQRAALTDAERRAQTDPLTGVLNRRSLVERLDVACLRAQARGLPISLLFIDLDHFKLINDSFGHQAGDACLRAIIEPIHAELRQSDVIGRFGGEEFVVILSSADAAAALPIAQRILDRVATVRVTGYGEPIGLTCSIGLAASDVLGVWGEQLLSLADAAVYAAKRAGRNRVHMAPRAAA